MCYNITSKRGKQRADPNTRWEHIMKFYAASHYYGTEFCNDYACLYRFDNRKERDEFVSDCNHSEGAGHYKTESVTRDEARRHFPNAFRMVGDFHDYSDERDWKDNDGNGEYWCDSNLFE